MLKHHENDLVITDLNESACRFHGYTREELIGQSISFIDPEFDPDVSLTLERLKAGESQSFEVTHRRKDGSTFPVGVFIRQIEVDGEPYLFSIERDLTESKKAEIEKAELEKSLRQKFKMEAIGNLAGGIAHDFNNILAIILGSSEMIMRKLPRDDVNIGRIERIVKAADRAKNLVEQVLAFSRRQEQSLNPVILTDMIVDTIELLRATIPRTVDMQLTFSSECSTLRVKADPNQLQQVLINLCNNAVFAMDEKGIIEIGLQRVSPDGPGIESEKGFAPEGYVQLSVADSGAGISDEQIEKIFDPFFTTKGVGQGTGMGLAVVHGIIQGHHGKIQVKSQPGEGTRFEIFLPVTSEDIQKEETFDGPLPTGSERILFVDDEEDLAVSAEELLIQQGFQTLRKSDSREALSLFRDDPHSFDLLITDQSMPEMSGLELIAEVKKIRPELPVILCTGFSTRISADTARQKGICAFLPKPYHEKQLLSAIRNCLDRT